MKFVWVGWVALLGGCNRDLLPVDPAGKTCNAELLSAGCESGRCRLSAPSGALPDGQLALVQEQPLPGELDGDAAADFVCVVSLADGVEPRAALTLAIKLGDGAPTDGALF